MNRNPTAGPVAGAPAGPATDGRLPGPTTGSLATGPATGGRLTGPPTGSLTTGRAAAAGDRLPRREAVGLRVLGMRVWQLVAVEVLVAGAAVVAVGRRTPELAATGIIAALGLGAVLGRHAHRPLLAWIPVWLVRHGRHRHPGTAHGDPRLAPLREILPALEVDGIDLRAGQRLAVCFDGTGWSAVVGLHREADALPGSAAAPWLPMRLLAQVLRVEDIPLASLQILVRTLPAPDRRLPADSPAAASYRQLGGSRIPAVRETFLTLRVDARTGWRAIEARGGGVDGARRALRRCVSRLLELLQAASVPARPLAETPWRATLLELAGLPATGHDPAANAGTTNPVPTGQGATRSQEDRRSWQAEGLVHVTWWVREFPNTPAPLQTLLDLASTVPAIATQVSFTLYPATTPPATPYPATDLDARPAAQSATPSGTVRGRALLRTTDRSPTAAEATATALLMQARALGVEVQRLDGEQGLGYLATLPLGGGTL